jgi:tetratricopeptide (TPR) repeat protein
MDMMRTVRLCVFLLASAILPLGTTGCASGVAQWIVRTRNHQGDVALEHRNYPDASIAYQLALKIDPSNVHARDGLTDVQIRLAQTLFANSKFEDAIGALAVAARYSPHDDRVQSMRGQIEQAEIKRDIVVSNYPNYKVTGAGILRSYNQLRTETNEISLALRRFDYTYDTADLSTAIRQSFALGAEVTRLTNRLQQYRQLVESGVPEHAGESLAPPASLLPLP